MNKELRKVIKDVLSIAPRLDPTGMQSAIYPPFYTLDEIGKIMDDIRSEQYAEKERKKKEV